MRKEKDAEDIAVTAPSPNPSPLGNNTQAYREKTADLRVPHGSTTTSWWVARYVSPVVPPITRGSRSFIKYPKLIGGGGGGGGVGGGGGGDDELDANTSGTQCSRT
ncbi:unnamed protein product [Schistocephalus solidus]|uniref:Uncharacterized protein n=1 Tax=Schistocephalus solidus TaxID=70667 RepID=A0A183TRF7_SCHSO|nr:unnamed protein product [Schistocephalus solidus]